MGTIDVQEPKVTDHKQAGGPAAAILPKPDVRTGTKFTPRQMFADSILEFGQQKKRRAFAITTSFVLNCLAIGVILIVPLVFTESLPKAQLLTFLVVPAPPSPPPPPAADQVPRVVRRIQTGLLNTGQLRTSTRIPQKVQMIRGEEAPPMPAGSGGVGGFGGVPGGQIGGVIGSTVSATSNLASVPTFVPPTAQRVRISQSVTKGRLRQKIAPAYPPLARAARVQGDVVLSAVLDANGQITNLQLVSGHPWLVRAAIAAVQQWRYKPYLLNGQPEVETTITVTFSRSSRGKFFRGVAGV